MFHFVWDMHKERQSVPKLVAEVLRFLARSCPDSSKNTSRQGLEEFFGIDKLRSIKADAVVNGRKSTITAFFEVSQTELRNRTVFDVHLHYLYKNGDLHGMTSIILQEIIKTLELRNKKNSASFKLCTDEALEQEQKHKLQKFYNGYGFEFNGNQGKATLAAILRSLDGTDAPKEKRGKGEPDGRRSAAPYVRSRERERKGTTTCNAKSAPGVYAHGRKRTRYHTN